MPLDPTVQTNFIAGYKTEFTGLNFPENAATQTANCVYTLRGDVYRRGGINYEANFNLNNINTPNVAHSSYVWTNVGGDGQTQILVKQIGSTLYFFLGTNATIASPLSTTLLASNITITTFQANGNSNNTAITECQFTDGNGYLIVYHKDCDPFYCTYNSSSQTITPTVINIQIRDFVGIPENVASNFRPTTLTPEHQYNLQNQGWSSGTPWTGISFNSTNSSSFPQGTYNQFQSITIPILSQTNTSTITNGSQIQINFANNFNPAVIVNMVITVSAYTTPFNTVTGSIQSLSVQGGSLAFPITFTVGGPAGSFVTISGGAGGNYTSIQGNLSLLNVGFINTWQSQIGNYPSNSDIWWLYKNTSNAFSPSTQISNVQQAYGPAPTGSFIIQAFNQRRDIVSGLTSLTAVTTATRPTTGCWFQGRVFYTGINSSQQATGDEPYTTWTENIYFSQTVVTPTDFGLCYQTNDPTSQNLFNILPTDGGVITIQGSGTIYKLFALRFGLLVFAANGVWFISGSTGIGFAANDYTVTPISNVQSTANTSYINVIGYPMFWNSEGIYHVTPASDAGSAHSPDIQLDVKNMCIGTIKTFYNSIPLISTKYARGDYDQVNYIVSWLYRSTAESSISNRYAYDSVLCLNTLTGAFYTYSLPTTSISTVCDLKYVKLPTSSTAPAPIFKYTTINGTNLTFSEENDFTRYVDFFSENSAGYNFVSSFTSGYNLAGKGLVKFNPLYIEMYLRNTVNNSYKVQYVWDYAVNRDSGRWSGAQLVQDNTSTTNFAMVRRRHMIRGRGYALQVFVTSVNGKPFDVMGWGLWNEVNPNV